MSLQSPSDGTQTCTKCGREKPLNGYFKDTSKRGGFMHRCKECEKERLKAWRPKNRERITAKIKEWVENHPESRKKKFLTDIKWRKLNASKINANTARRRARKANATPIWLTEDHHKEIGFFYWFASSIKGLHGLAYHVDHIHPLKGKGLCGLHVPWNLRVVSSVDNVSKGNRMIEGEI